MPGMSGIELQETLARHGQVIPTVFITGQMDPDICPRVLAAGAVACLRKPFHEAALIKAVNAALHTRE